MNSQYTDHGFSIEPSIAFCEVDQDPRFIHLRVHSDYSLVDGLAKPSRLAQYAAQQGMPALALTDHESLAGWIQFSKAALACGVKPIVGVDILMRFSEHLQGRITLLAQNYQGYQALLRLTTQVCTDRPQAGSPGIPGINSKFLATESEGLILLCGGHDGILTRAVEDEPLSQSLALFFKQHFPDRAFIEIERMGWLQETRYNPRLLQLAKRYHLPIVATNKLCFLQKKEYEAHKVRIAIQRGIPVTSLTGPEAYTPDHYFKSSEQMQALFSDLPEALHNSVEIAKRCSAFPPESRYHLPEIKLVGQTNQALLERLSFQGIENRLTAKTPLNSLSERLDPTYLKRLRYELDLIHRMGFDSYFLVVHEFVQWAKAEEIPVGPGRGSGAGSLVAYGLGITDLDPMPFQLLFERFLNPERLSLPDFDIDFCPRGRDRVIQHVIDTYGVDSVAQIATFGTMTARAVVRDVGRALGHPYGFIDRIAKLIPFELGMTLEKALQVSELLKQAYEQDEEVQALVDLARSLEGVTRNIGKHAGGVVITPKPLVHYTALTWDAEGAHRVTQLDKDDLEEIGLIKFDFLGLKTLTILQSAVVAINQEKAARGSPPMSLMELPIDDKKSFDLLKSAETVAIFQIESRGMRELVRKLSPDRFEEIIALLALYRPGPLQAGMVDNFINRKHGREVIAYPDIRYQHSCLEPVLKETYGVILYQEQVMQIAQVLAGYSLAEADVLRRAIGKKKPKVMEQQRHRFVEGARQKGIDSNLSTAIFDLVEKFSGYGFNKSHSAAYALISYQTLYIKAHYPHHFMAAVLNADMDHTEKLPPFFEEVKRLGLMLYGPDVNQSQYEFTAPSSQQLYYGLGAIRGLGLRVSQALISARTEQGAFRSLEDLCRRVSPQELPRSALEKLIFSGAMDSLDSNRARLIQQLPQALQSAAQQHRQAAAGQQDLFGIDQMDLIVRPVEGETAQTTWAPGLWTEHQRLKFEHEALGHYLTGHPLDLYAEEFRYCGVPNPGQRLVVSENRRTNLVIPVLVQKVRLTRSKRGETLCLMQADSRAELIEAIWSEPLTKQLRDQLQKGALLIFSGAARREGGTGKIRVSLQKVESLVDLRRRHLRFIELVFHGDGGRRREETVRILLKRLQQVLSPFQSQAEGVPCRVLTPHRLGLARWQMGLSWKLLPDERLLKSLMELGPLIASVRLQYPDGTVIHPLVPADAPEDGVRSCLAEKDDLL